MALLKDWFGWEGPYTAQQRRTEEAHQDSRAKIEQFITSAGFQDKLRAAQTDAINQGRSIYGGRGRGATTVDPIEKAGKYALAAQRLTDAGAKDAGLSVLQEANKVLGMAEGPAGHSRMRKPSRPNLKSRGGGVIEGAAFWIPDEEAEEYLGKGWKREGVPKEGKADLRSLFGGGNEFDGILTPDTQKTQPAGKKVKDMSDFFQAPTELSPMDTVPKTFAQIGITAKDDIQTFNELEKKLPDMDLRSQYQINKAGFDKILSALKAGKTPDGKPFTIKDAIAFIQANQ